MSFFSSLIPSNQSPQQQQTPLNQSTVPQAPIFRTAVLNAITVAVKASKQANSYTNQSSKDPRSAEISAVLYEIFNMPNLGSINQGTIIPSNGATAFSMALKGAILCCIIIKNAEDASTGNQNGQAQIVNELKQIYTRPNLANLSVVGSVGRNIYGATSGIKNSLFSGRAYTAARNTPNALANSAKSTAKNWLGFGGRRTRRRRGKGKK